MTKSKSFKVGCVRLRLRSPDTWQADYRDPNTSRRERVTIKAASEADARRQAKSLHEEVVSGRFQKSQRREGPTVAQALEAAIANSNGNLKTRKQYTWNANRFLQWLGLQYPAAKFWSDIKTDMLRTYAAYCHRELGLARPTVHYRLLPLKTASRYWSENEPEQYRDIGHPVRLPKDDANPLERMDRERTKALSAADTLALLEYLKEERPDLYPPAMLQALCGLRVLEALALRECDVDFDKGTVRITETPHHRPKTRSSFRTIPVPAVALDVVRGVISRLPIGDCERPIFYSNRGQPWAGFDGYCHALRRAVRSCSQDCGIEHCATTTRTGCERLLPRRFDQNAPTIASCKPISVTVVATYWDFTMSRSARTK